MASFLSAARARARVSVCETIWCDVCTEEEKGFPSPEAFPSKRTQVWGSCVSGDQRPRCQVGTSSVSGRARALREPRADTRLLRRRRESAPAGTLDGSPARPPATPRGDLRPAPGAPPPGGGCFVSGGCGGGVVLVTTPQRVNAGC